MIRENGELPILKLISSTKPRQNPTIPSTAKTDGRAQNSCSLYRYCPLETVAAAIQVALLVPSCCPASGSLLEVAYGASTAIGYVVSKATRSYTPRPESMQMYQRMLHQVGKRGRDSLLEAMGHVMAKVTWPMESTGQCTM